MFKEHKELLTAIGGVLVLLLLALTISTAVGIQNKVKEGHYIGQDIESKNTISVSGQSKVYADPDLATIDFSVVTEKDTVKEALQENKAKMNKIIQGMKNEGIGEKDLKTTTFDIRPRYEWREKSNSRQEGERELVGYEVTQKLQTKIRNLKQVGEIIKMATGAGANRVDNIQFTIEEKEELRQQAKEEAIQKAKEKAQETASLLGVDLVKIVDFSEGFVSPRGYGSEMTKEMAEDSTPQIEPGQNKVEANVTITYRIN
ncbi:MAG: SIMPL domain-containing protein [Candidatus Paceibacterota bacterium]